MRLKLRMLPKILLGCTVGLLTLSYISLAYSKFPNTDTHPTTFLGPTLALDYTGVLTPLSAFSLIGEMGVKNFRLGATFGWTLTEASRLKITGEWLWQDLTYSFYSGNADHWMSQGAAGAALQYDLGTGWNNPQFNLSGYYSHAPSATLATTTGSFLNSVGDSVVFTNVRRIAGSTAGGASAGLSFNLWENVLGGLALNYDTITYNVINSDRRSDGSGLGGTAYIKQTFGNHVAIDAVAQISELFNNYVLNLSYNDFYYHGRWSAGLFGDYTRGKLQLPNSWNAGLSLNYLADNVMLSSNVKSDTSQARNNNKQFLDWVRDPAVHMPQVLARVDQSVTFQSCVGPKVISPITNQTYISNQSFDIPPIDTASHFSGANLTFDAVGLPVNLDIDPGTGVISGTLFVTTAEETFPVTVIATNNCGSVSTTFTIVEGSM